MISLLFTASSSPVSVAIRSITKEPVSHVAILLFNKLVVHCNLLGVGYTSYEHFNSHCTIVYRLDLSTVSAEDVFEKTSKYEGNQYDFLALLWLGLCYITRTHRTYNQWANRHKYTCTEFVTDVILGEADSVISPYQLYQQQLQKLILQNKGEQ